MGAVVAVVLVVVVVGGLVVWERLVWWPRIQERLRRLDDDRLEDLWRAPLDGRQRGWVQAERDRRRGAA